MAGRALAAAATAVVVVSLSGFRTATPLAAATGNDPAVMDEFVRIVTWVSDTYNTGPISIGTAPLPSKNTFAITQGWQIVFNTAYTTQPWRLSADMQRNVEAGWIPGGCTPVATVALHEAGHVIDNLRNRIGTRRVAAAYGDGESLWGQVSLYSFGDDAIFDPDEAVASAFQSVLCNGGTPVEQDMYWMLVNP